MAEGAQDRDELVRGLVDAVRRAVGASGVERPFVVELACDPSDIRSGSYLPGVVRVGSASFRDRARSMLAVDGAALGLVRRGDEAPGQVARIELTTACDPATRRLCRELDDRLASDPDLYDVEGDGAGAELGRIAARLAQALNEPGSLPGVAEPFLAIVDLGSPGEAIDGLERAAAAVGEERIARFLASVASTIDPGQEEANAAAARFDRVALERWLRDRGLDRHARTIAHDHALPAFRLEAAGPADRPCGRIGGPALLPPGATWPRGSTDRPLSFLAGIDLSALPEPLPGGPSLPAAGWLLFYADLEGDGDSPGFIGEPTPNAEGADARVLWTDGGEPVIADPPADLSADAEDLVGQRALVARPQLTLPDGYDDASLAGLRPPEAEAYDEIANSLRASGAAAHEEDDELAWADDDWLLGAVTGVQGQTPEPGTSLLLHLASIEWLDGGAIQFRLPTTALAAGDWSQVHAEGDSG